MSNKDIYWEDYDKLCVGAHMMINPSYVASKSTCIEELERNGEKEYT